jgi:excisionase family DNA binding protein
MPNDLISYTEAAKILHVTRRTLVNKVAAREITHYRIGTRKVLFSRADIEGMFVRVEAIV